MFDLINEFEKAQQRSLQYLGELTRLWHLLVYTEELEEAEKKRHANIKKVYAMAEAELKKRKTAASIHAFIAIKPVFQVRLINTNGFE